MCPRLVSSSHIWLRKHGRSMAPAEALALQGFSHEIQQECDPPLTSVQLMDLAGNAFNAAVLIPIVTACVACLDLPEAYKLSQAFQLVQTAVLDDGVEVLDDDGIEGEVELSNEEGEEEESGDDDMGLDSQG